ncbi:response regulator transcription factor [Novosphingobium sp. FSW06-99]|uniref:response regulator transcription factor n=1 Tax=Novosphingobium sp. FSW06-99 TaxID=1739113 RepID=UPI00076D9828|nr:response regulator [Novosphingobium sp. FSW06-99]KUR74815.1 two-component system response regulator [Novosphingobium sp. FSW06-99]
MDQLATIHIIDDDDNVRTSLDLLLRSAGYRTRLYGALDDFAPAEAGQDLGCILLDVRMPGANGLEFHEALARQGTRLSVIMMTGHGDIPMSVRAMKAGAIDFLPKPFETDQMLDAVATALERDRERIEQTSSQADLHDRFASLSMRERQVMALATAGRMNKQAAFELGLSEITVKVYRRLAMRKMNARTLADLVRMAQTLGLTPESLAREVPDQ